MATIEKLLDLIQKGNIATSLKEEQLNEIATKVCKEYQADRDSRSNWEERAEEALKFSKQIVAEKTFPWPGASNVVFPLITLASNVFAARVYPEIIKDSKIVKVAVFGDDQDGSKDARANRVSAHMSYQRLIESDTWEPDTDKLLHMLPVVGVAFRKVYYDPISEMTQSDLCNPADIVINNNVSSVEKAQRITHRYYISKNEAIEKIRSGYFVDIDIEELTGGSHYSDTFDTQLDSPDYSDHYEVEDSPIEILEQHTYEDLDGDGYKEPYIIIVHKASSKTLGIYPRFTGENDIKINDKGEILRITPRQYFIDYHFLPSPDGSFYSLGYGHILYPLNKAINSLLNQLIDSGTLSNTQSGIITNRLKIKGGSLKVQMGEFVQVNSGSLKDDILPMPFKDPSPVLLQLLSLVIDSAREIASINDIITGEAKPQNSPASSVLEIASQGMKLFNSISKRLYRSLKKEFKLLYKLNGEYLDPQVYFNFLDSQEAVLQQDYQGDDLDICPVADPSMSSDLQRSMQMQAITVLLQNQAILPYIKLPSIVKEFFEALRIPDYKIKQFVLSPEELAQQQQQQAQQPNPEQQKIELEMAKMQKDFQIKMQQEERARSELELKMMEMQRKYSIKDAETAEKQKRMLADAAYKNAQASHLDDKLEIERSKVEAMHKKIEVEEDKVEVMRGKARDSE